ncbi:MAG: hypothetical protein ABI572_07180 [Actinomycetota bacterium]
MSMETPMDDVTNTAESLEDVENPKAAAPPSPRAGDEKAYEDSWYQVLKGWQAPATAADDVAADDDDDDES